VERFISEIRPGRPARRMTGMKKDKGKYQITNKTISYSLMSFPLASYLNKRFSLRMNKHERVIRVLE
jgi:hypothetical protein